MRKSFFFVLFEKKCKVKNTNLWSQKCIFAKGLHWDISRFSSRYSDAKFWVGTRRFYLTGDMKNLSPFIQASLEWPFSELFSGNVSLWNQCKFIAFNIFSCRISMISYKMLIITGISNEKTNELTIYEKLCRNFTIFYRQELASLF